MTTAYDLREQLLSKDSVDEIKDSQKVDTQP